MSTTPQPVELANNLETIEASAMDNNTPAVLKAIFRELYYMNGSAEDMKAARIAWPQDWKKNPYTTNIRGFFQNILVTAPNAMAECRIRKAAIKAIPRKDLPEHIRDQKVGP